MYCYITIYLISLFALQLRDSSVKDVFSNETEDSHVTPEDSYAIYCALFENEDTTVEDLMLDCDEDNDVHPINVIGKQSAEHNEENRCVLLKYAILAVSLNTN